MDRTSKPLILVIRTLSCPSSTTRPSFSQVKLVAPEEKHVILTSVPTEFFSGMAIVGTLGISETQFNGSKQKPRVRDCFWSTEKTRDYLRTRF